MLKKIEVHRITIPQLESLKDNSKSFINPCDRWSNEIWENDIIALDNAIEIIKEYQRITSQGGQSEYGTLRPTKPKTQEVQSNLSVLPRRRIRR